MWSYRAGPIRSDALHGGGGGGGGGGVVVVFV